VRTEGYTRDQIGKVIQLRATVEGLRALPTGYPLLIAFASRYVLQLLTPALILAQRGGRTQIELEDIGEMTNLFLDSKTNASNLAKGRGFDGGKMW